MKDLLIKSVESRHNADVPVAYCLSGGIDSNALIGIASKALGYEVNGFTITSSCKDYGEEELVDIAIESNNINHSYISPKFNIFKNLKELIKTTEAPVFTINYLAHSLLLREISNQGYKVTISGPLQTSYSVDITITISTYQLYTSGSSLYNSKSNWEKVILPNVRNPYFRDLDSFLENPSSRDIFQFNSSNRWF